MGILLLIWGAGMILVSVYIEIWKFSQHTWTTSAGGVISLSVMITGRKCRVTTFPALNLLIYFFFYLYILRYISRYSYLNAEVYTTYSSGRICVMYMSLLLPSFVTKQAEKVQLNHGGSASYIIHMRGYNTRRADGGSRGRGIRLCQRNLSVTLRWWGMTS